MFSTFQRVFLAICLTAGLAVPTLAQGVVPAGAASFRNNLTVPVVVQGYSKVGPLLKRGAPMVIAPGKSLTEFGVPAGVRVYNVYDANQPQRKLVSDVQVPVFPGRPVVRVIRQLPNKSIVVAPE
ncbi:MAG TPA: hypothetical protein VHR72_05460 [Gemmataceae bacterium]|jgi:hypothetical protein|nr:hypothetical protein [Gemmataceae bacterium]